MHPPYEVQSSSGAARGEEGDERKLEEQQQPRDGDEANNAAPVVVAQPSPSKCEFKYVGFEVRLAIFFIFFLLSK